MRKRLAFFVGPKPNVGSAPAPDGAPDENEETAASNIVPGHANNATRSRQPRRPRKPAVPNKTGGLCLAQKACYATRPPEARQG